MSKDLIIFSHTAQPLSTCVGSTFSLKNNEWAFAYTNEWCTADNLPLSLKLPFNKACCQEDLLLFLDNLLPEGNRRSLYAKLNKIPLTDTLELLLHYGEDTAGQFSFVPPERIVNSPEDITDDLTLRIANQESLDAVPNQHMSLAGAENKITVTIKEDFGESRYFLPDMEHPSTHIIKTSQSTSINEALCMRLATRCLPADRVAASSLEAFAGREAFVTLRYDRVLDQGHVLRLHQEDFCQALNRSKDDKYCLSYHDHGIQNKDIARLLETTLREDIVQKEKHFFITALAFSMCIGNFDDHAKNYALLHHPDGLRLAPLYDILSVLGAKRLTREWATVDTCLARPFGKERDPLRIKRRDVDLFAEEFNVEPQVVMDIFKHTGETILQCLPETKQTFFADCTKKAFSSATLHRIEEHTPALESILTQRTTQMLDVMVRAKKPDTKKQPRM